MNDNTGTRLRGLAVAALLLSSAPLRAAVMTDGPLVGAVDHQSAKVFARTDVEADVQIQYHADSGPCAGVHTTDALGTKLASDYTAIVSLTGLCASTKYSYNVLVNGVAQFPLPEPSFLTFPVPSANVPFEFAVLADLRGSFTAPPVAAPAYVRIHEDDPAFVAQIGDFDHRDPTGLDACRAMHRDVRGGPTNPSGIDFHNNIAMFYPFFHVWDDHDLGRDNADKRFAGIVSARRAFFEYYPLPTLSNPNNGMWHSFRYGQADFFVLDLRSQRDPDYDPDGPEHSMLDGDGIPNGQKDWLKNGLLTSTARWKFILSSVPFNKNSGKRDDSWMGFMTERTEMVDFIKSHGITGVIFVSGDLHSGGMIDDGLNSDFPEISVPHTNLEQPGPNPCAGTGCRDFWSVGTIGGFEILGGYAYFIVGTNPDQVTLQAKDSTGAVRLQYVVAAQGGSTDLSLTGTDSPDPVLIGSPLTYVLTARNDGPVPATNASVNDVLPASVTLVSATSSQGTCTGTATVTCSLGTLAVGATATVTIVVTPTLAETLTATAAAVASEFDPDSTDNVVTSTTAVLAPDLVESVNPPPASSTVGGVFTVSDRVRNNGTGAAGASTARYYLSLDTSRDASDVLLSGTRAVPGLQPDEQSLGDTSVTVPSISPGIYYLLACADDLGQVVESLEGNNCEPATSTISISGAGGADLSVTNIDSPDPVILGGNVTYTAVARNNGPGSASSVVVTAPLQASVTFVSATSTQGSCTGTSTVTCAVGGLASGAQATVTIVGKTTVAETLTMTASVAAAELDPNPADNSAAATTAVVAPDLVESVTNPPASGSVGSSFSVTDRARNNGAVSAGASTTRFYLSLDTAKSADDRLMTGTRAVPVLAPNVQSVGTLDVTIPSDTTVGSYYVLACADDLGVVAESLEGNNCRASTSTIAVTLLKRADLSLTTSDAPDPVNVGAPLTYTAVVGNDGPNAGTGVTLTLVLPATATFVSVTPTQGTCTGTATVTCSLGGVAVGATATVTAVVTPTAEGTLTLTGSVVGLESDLHTTNNSSTSTTTVASPDLVESVNSPPASAARGSSFTATDRARNKGGAVAGASTTRYYLSVDTAKGTGDPLLTGSRAVPSLAPDAQSVGTASVTIPTSVVTGVYYLLACADDLGVVTESLEGNNCQASAATVNVTP